MSKAAGSLLQSETTTKAVIYARISSVSQSKKGQGLASQETRCREFARMKGYEVAKVFVDRAVSGGVTNRPGIQNALSYMDENREGGPFVLLIDDISRIARGIRAHLDLRDAIRDVGAGLESPSIEFGEDSDSILVENLLASVSQHQRQKNAEQTRNRMRARLQNGYWPFYAPIGFKFERQPGRGNVLVRDEPLASVIQEAIEGFEVGRFQLQSEVARFLQSQPCFPKNRFGVVTNEAANRILTRILYAGMLDAPESWNVPLRKGQHEPIVSYETFLKVQERIKGRALAPARADISNDFILRGAVCCADCGNPMTASWSTSKSGKKHPYYMCFKKGCESYRKSIRRDEMETAFADLLQGLVPTRRVITFAQGMFRDIWTQLQVQAEALKGTLLRDIRNIEADIEKLLDRIGKAESEGVIAAYEKRIAALEKDKLAMSECLENTGVKKPAFRELFEHAMLFLSNPRALWDSGRFEYRQTVLKLCFAQAPQYCRKEGFRTPVSAYPFRLLHELCGGESQMAEREGFEPSVRKAHNGFRDRPVRPLRHLSVKAGSYHVRGKRKVRREWSNNQETSALPVREGGQT